MMDIAKMIPAESANPVEDRLINNDGPSTISMAKGANVQSDSG